MKQRIASALDGLEKRWKIVAIGVGALLILAQISGVDISPSGLWGSWQDLPRNLRFFAYMVVFGGVIFRGLGPLVAKMFDVVNWVWVLELDASREVARLHKFTPVTWDNAVVTNDGDPYKPRNSLGVWIVRSVEWNEENGLVELTAPWMGLVSSYELWTSRTRIGEIYDYLESEAKKKLVYRVLMSTIVLEALSDIVMVIVAGVEKGIIPDEKAIERAIEERVEEQFGSFAEETEPPEFDPNLDEIEEQLENTVEDKIDDNGGE